MGCRTPIRQMPAGILFLKVSVLFGKSEFANPLKDCDIIGISYGLPNSDSANAGRDTFFSKDCVLFGKSEFANPLKFSVLFGKSEFANPLKLSVLFGKSEFANPIFYLRFFSGCQRRELSFLVQEFSQIGILGNKETRNSQTDTYPTCQIEGIAQN